MVKYYAVSLVSIVYLNVNKGEGLPDRLWTSYNEITGFQQPVTKSNYPWIDTDPNKDVNNTRKRWITLNEFNYLLWMTDLHETRW